MKRSVAAESPDAYVKALGAWQKLLVKSLRRSVRSVGDLEERIKWGHLVYFSNGPVLLIRAEDHRVILGFWRGKRLRELEQRLKPGGKYELANLLLLAGDKISPSQVKRLALAAIALNEKLGDPTAASTSAA